MRTPAWLGRALLIALLSLIPLLLIFSARSGPPERVWLRAPGWSRAQVVGTTTLDQPTPIAVDAGGAAYLFLVHGSASERQPHIVALDQRTAVRWERALDARHRDLRDPQIVWDGRNLALFWIGDGQLFTARLDPAGELVAAPQVVSGEVEVADYSATRAAERVVVWFAGTPATPGIFAAQPDSPGTPPPPIRPAGERPQLRSDAAGNLHAIWLERTADRTATLHYSRVPDQEPAQLIAQPLAEVGNLGAGAEVTGPWFGLDATHGYVGWHTRITSGMRAGQRFALHTAFPLAAPEQVAELQSLLVPESAILTYPPATNAPLNSGARMALTDGGGGPPAGMFANPAPADELALACETVVNVGSGQRVPQVCALYFQQGAPAGFQLLSLSERSAFAPALISDAAGNLYLTWRELRAEGAVVFFAGTAPELNEALGRISLDDLLRLASNVVFGMLPGMIFVPFAALLWIGPALLLLLPHALLQRAGVRTGRWGPALSLVLAIGGYWTAKLIVLGAAYSGVPFAQWLPPIPPGPALALQILTPLMIAGGALYGAWRASYGRGVPSVTLFVLGYTAIDTVATMAVYGAGLFGP
jgi:hypothetical protein